MSDDLRTRIAAVLHSSVSVDYPTWDESLVLADAVIRELALERQDHYDPYCDHYRYVTDWIADD